MPGLRSWLWALIWSVPLGTHSSGVSRWPGHILLLSQKFNPGEWKHIMSLMLKASTLLTVTSAHIPGAEAGLPANSAISVAEISHKGTYRPLVGAATESWGRARDGGRGGQGCLLVAWLYRERASAVQQTLRKALLQSFVLNITINPDFGYLVLLAPKPCEGLPLCFPTPTSDTFRFVESGATCPSASQHPNFQCYYLYFSLSLWGFACNKTLLLLLCGI